MGRERTCVKGIFTDDSRNLDHLTDMSPDKWVQGVRDTLCALQTGPCATSRAILDGITDSGKEVTIIPAFKRPPIWARNAYAEPLDTRTATAPGKPTEGPPGEVGEGGGSGGDVQFVAQDWDPVTSAAFSLDAVDEVLLHELVHSLRQALGQEDNSPLPPPMSCMGRGGITDFSRPETNLNYQTLPPPTSITQLYDNLEEFAAILITNIYRSENRRLGLVRDHLATPDSQPNGPRDPRGTTNSLGWPLTKPRNFMTLWKAQITRLSVELDVEHVASMIANVDCAFNPFRELMRK
jgi:hypothetical protein